MLLPVIGGLEKALVMTLLPKRSALPRRLFADCAGTGDEAKRKLSTTGAGAAGIGAAAEKAEEKSANSLDTGGGALAAETGWLPPKADAKSPKSAVVSSALGSKSSMGATEEAELKISSIISLLFFTGSSPNKSALCVLRCVGEFIPNSLAFP